MPERIAIQSDEFAHVLETYSPRYGVQLGDRARLQLRGYYEHVMAWNPRLHLVAPCSPAEFATRHVLESLLMLAHLSPRARVTDVGSGAGLPIIPCLIVRPDLRATLIEASPKKAIFLRETLRRVHSQSSTKVIAERFERLPQIEADFVTCRALDRFSEMFSKLVVWSPPASTLLLFGGHNLREQIEMASLDYRALHLPQSEQRFLFVIKKDE